MTDFDCIPFIEIPILKKPPLKFLIDSGANKNYIKPEHVKKSKTCEAMRVKDAKGTEIINQFVTFNPFPTSKSSKSFPFYVYNFHDFFDGLIGYETLQQIKAKINAAHNTLELPDMTFKLKKKFPDMTTLNAHETKIVSIPSKHENGDLVLETNVNLSQNVIIPSGLYKVENAQTTVLICNLSPYQTQIKIPTLTSELNNVEVKLHPDACQKEKKPDLNTFQTLKTEHLNTEEKRQLTNLLREFSSRFHIPERKLTFTNAIKHRINTKDEIPVYTKSYRYPFCHKEEVQKQIKTMLNDGIIRHSDSPWSSPVWVVPKKKDNSGKKKWRMVIDYRKLNEKTIDDRYPIPDITDILDKLGKANYFSTLDLSSGFHQIEVDPRDIQKTAFSVENGHYEFLRMPFGLKNAPSTFQRAMDNILREFVGKFCLVYMDDIIIYSTSLQEHIGHLKTVFKKLEEFELKLQIDKCEFLCKEVGYLGHVVTPEGIKPNPDKIKVIRNWPLPKTEKDLRSFLGTLGYYRRFIKDLARIIKPMTEQLRKKEEIKSKKQTQNSTENGKKDKNKLLTITPQFIEAFEKCKKLLTGSDILHYPDLTKEFILTTDASNFALGAVLSQGPIGKDKPIAFASRTLTNTEQNYSTIEKELLALVWACKYFRPYLYGRKFILYTDHQPLTYAFGLKNTNNRLVRWRLSLAEYVYEIKYRPGKQNVVADSLSRLVNEINLNTLSSDETVHSAESDAGDLIGMTENPLNQFSNQIILNVGPDEPDRVENVFGNIRHIITRIDYGVSTLINIFKDKMDLRRLNGIFCPESLIPSLQVVYRNYFARAGVLKVKITQIFRQDVMETEEQDTIIKDTHERAHRGIDENYKAIMNKYFFPNAKKKIRIFINLCHICKKAKYDRKPYNITLAETPIPKRPLDILHVDVFFSHNEIFLSAVDKLSKFAMLIPIPSRTIPDVRSAITQIISTYGQPKLIVSDNEPALKSIEIRGFLQQLGIEQYFAPSGNSEINGIVERFHSTLSELFRCIKDKYNHLENVEIYKIAVTLYNDTIHSTHQLKPREVFFGLKEGEERPLNIDEIITNRDKIFDEAIVRLKEKQQQMLKTHNKDREQEPEFQPDEKLYLKDHRVRNKTSDRFKPIKVTYNYRKTFKDNKGRKIHKTKIKRKTA